MKGMMIMMMIMIMLMMKKKIEYSTIFKVYVHCIDRRPEMS